MFVGKELEGFPGGAVLAPDNAGDAGFVSRPEHSPSSGLLTRLLDTERAWSGARTL